jgi:hypothetical protein
MMKDYYQQSMRTLQLAGMSQPTQKGYIRSVRMLVDYFLHRRNIDKWSGATKPFSPI